MRAGRTSGLAWISLVFLACLGLAACLNISDRVALEKEIVANPAFAGEWEALVWFPQDGGMPAGQPYLHIAERQQQGRPVYAVTSDTAKFTARIRDVVTLYTFGEAQFLLNGDPRSCNDCILLKYFMTEDGKHMAVQSLNRDKAVRFLQMMRADTTKIVYGVEGSVGNIRVLVLDDEARSLLAAIGDRQDLWDDGAILTRRE